MKKKRQYLILGFLVIAVIVTYSAYKYTYKDHRDIASEKIDFEVQPTELNKAMSSAQSSQRYIDKVIQTQGIITSIEQQSVILEDKIQVNFSIDNINSLKANSELKIKGRCVGYDDLLELVKIDQATIINN